MEFPTYSKKVGGGMVVPSDTPIRIFNVHFRCTATPSNIVFQNTSGTVTTTTTNSVFLSVDNEVFGTCGNWDSDRGILFPNGVFIQSSANVGLITLTYKTEKY